MRQILVDYARQQEKEKTLGRSYSNVIWEEQGDGAMERLREYTRAIEALTTLAAKDAQKSQRLSNYGG